MLNQTRAREEFFTHHGRSKSFHTLASVARAKQTCYSRCHSRTIEKRAPCVRLRTRPPRLLPPQFRLVEADGFETLLQSLRALQRRARLFGQLPVPDALSGFCALLRRAPRRC